MIIDSKPESAKDLWAFVSLDGYDPHVSCNILT